MSEAAFTSTALPALLDRIDGSRARPAIALGEWVRDANDGAPLDPQVATDPGAIDRAIVAADRAHEDGAWRQREPAARALVLERIASELEARREEMALADARTTGVVVSLTRALASITSHAFRGAAAELRAGAMGMRLEGPTGPVDVLRVPWGPAAVIAPWNAPAAIASHKVASALAAGCPVILKPSEWAPHSCALIADAVEAAGLPRGVFQLVHGAGAVGAQLAADGRVRAVSFTGGLAGGRAVAAACAKDLRPVQLELGGNNALVVLDDADLDLAAAGIVMGLTTLNGQWCRAVGRILVHAPLEEALRVRVMERLAAVKLGSSLSAESAMGPLVHRGHLAQVRAAIDAACSRGAVAHASTPLPTSSPGGNFLAPTLLTGVSPADARHEIFGPVATVHPFATIGEGIALANDSPFGLAAYVFGKDETRALAVARELRAGSIKVNGVSLLALHPRAPRPAWGLSGLGDEGTLATLHFFCGTRVVGVAGARP